MSLSIQPSPMNRLYLGAEIWLGTRALTRVLTNFLPVNAVMES